MELQNILDSDLEVVNLQYYPGDDGFGPRYEWGNGWANNKDTNINYKDWDLVNNDKRVPVKIIASLVITGLSFTTATDAGFDLSGTESFFNVTHRQGEYGTTHPGINSVVVVGSPDKASTLRLLNTKGPSNLSKSMVTFTIDKQQYSFKFEDPNRHFTTYPVDTNKFALVNDYGRKVLTINQINQDGTIKEISNSQIPGKNDFYDIENVRSNDVFVVASLKENQGYLLTNSNSYLVHLKSLGEKFFLPPDKTRGLAQVDLVLPVAKDGMYAVLIQDSNKIGKVGVAMINADMIPSNDGSYVPKIISEFTLGENVSSVNGFSVFKKTDSAFSQSDFISVSYVENGKNYIKVFEISDKGELIKSGKIQNISGQRLKVENVRYVDKKYLLNTTYQNLPNDIEVKMYSEKK
jgi:hypothetical protein